MATKEKQESFFLSPAGTEFHIRRKSGDEAIKPKKKKEKKKIVPKPAQTPFQELMAYYSVMRLRKKMLEENGEGETLDGGYRKRERGQVSDVGEVDTIGPFKNITGDLHLPEIPVLSETARRLRFKWEREHAQH